MALYIKACEMGATLPTNGESCSWHGGVNMWVEHVPNTVGFIPSITAAEGLEISSLIIALWAVAWAAAQLVKVLKPNANN